MNPHAYAQADAMQQLKQSFAPKPYMPWFAQQAPTANWGKTYNTAAWMPPTVMTPGTVGTGGTNLGLGGMFGYTGPYGASPGPGVGTSTTWGGLPGSGTLTQPVMPNLGTTANRNPLSFVPSTGIPVQSPTTPSGTPVYGTPTNTQTQNEQAAAEMGNPLPPPTGPTNVSGVEGFLDSFRFSNPTTPEQTKFNQLASQYGVNDAWSWATSNAWNQLGPSLRSAMYAAELPNDDIHRIINTYAARTNDLGEDSPYGYSSNWLKAQLGVL
jgi:hypothetical protein